MLVSVSQRFRAWVDRRIPASTSHTLKQNNLFIFPTPAGFAYLVVAVLVWLTGTNYENNLVLGLAYLLLSVFIVAIHHTFFNLSGVCVEVLKMKPGFAGGTAVIRLKISNDQKGSRYALRMYLENEEEQWLSLESGASETLEIPVTLTRRGWQNVPRVAVETRFPLGLLRCWTWLTFDARLLVYPRPLPSAEPPYARGGEQEGQRVNRIRGDEFSGLQRYQPGHRMSDIAWKHYARSGTLYSREHSQESGSTAYLDWASTAGDTERRLSELCYWVTVLAEKQPLGLILPTETIDPEMGDQHHRRLLRTLALYGVSS